MLLYQLLTCLSLSYPVLSAEILQDSSRTNVSLLASQHLLNELGATDGYLQTSRFLSFVEYLLNSSRPYEGPSAVAECGQDEDCLRLQTAVKELGKCPTPQQLLSLVSGEREHWNPETSQQPLYVTGQLVQDVCPVLLQQLRLGSCAARESSDYEDQENGKSAANPGKPSTLEVWGFGFLFVTIINLSSIMGVSLLPFMGRTFYNRLLTMLVGLAVGSLSSSAAFHLIPQAFNLLPKEPGQNHAYLWTSLNILLGIYAFFMVERILKVIMEAKERQAKNKKLALAFSDMESLRYNSGNNHRAASPDLDGYRPAPAVTSSSTVLDPHALLSHRVSELTSDSMHQLCTGSAPSLTSISATVDSSSSDPVTPHVACDICHANHPTHKHEHHIQFKQGQDSAIATVAWMIVFGDGLHNFIDGLSIGAAFNENILTGISISLAVMCEEFPHELGDFAVLLNSGMTMKQALLYNFLSACTCYVGLVCGVLLGEFYEASAFIFAIAAGVFLYISLVDMVPEMNEEVEKASQDGVWDACKIILLQNIGWFLGTAILFLLAYHSDKITLV